MNPSRFAGLKGLLKLGTADAAAAAAATGGDDEAGVGTAYSDASLQAAFETAEADGFKAGTARAVAVFSSDKGQAHRAAAAKMLGNAKLDALSAEEVIDMLAEVPAAGAPAAAAPAGTEPGQAGTSTAAIEAATGKIDLKTGQAAGQTGDGSDRAKEKAAVTSVQDEVLARVGAYGAVTGMVGGFKPAVQ